MASGEDLIKALKVSGTGNQIDVGEGSNVHGLQINGDNNCVRIGRKCLVGGLIILKCKNSRLFIGDETTIMGIQLTMHETGTIRIGADCMFAGNIRMDVSDMHSIIDVASGKRTNPAKNIDIGDHVWLGYDCFIAKGSQIGSHSIIGAKSFVTGVIPANSLAVGVPARVKRSGVTWDRRRI